MGKARMITELLEAERYLRSVADQLAGGGEHEESIRGSLTTMIEATRAIQQAIESIASATIGL